MKFSRQAQPMLFRSQNRRMHRKPLAVVLLAAVAAGSTGWAAEAPPATTGKEPASGSSATSGPTEQTETSAAADVFIPTEDISEDFAVAFPVDI